MKIIVVGGTGTIGKAVVKELSQRHEIITVGHKSGDVQADIQRVESIEKMYKHIGEFDAVVSTVGNLHFGPLEQFTPELYDIGLKSKLMGQINLVLIGKNYVKDNGSFTLTSGILSDDPIRFGSSAGMVNSALDGFVRAAAIEMPKNLRINVVSPTILTESLPQYGDFFHGFESVSASRVALAYSKSVEGAQTGKIYKVW
ncbi:MAG: short chain dehydrogenase [Gammaproteobacteria bacterium]|nr:short chain dehydrogenase [Gammaproteobacteria bacterium]